MPASTKTSSPRKRQQKLTNFFSATSASGTSTILNKDIKLAPDVQSGLISVGMRIRKSVPEGYKSGSYAYNKHLPSTGGYMGGMGPPDSLPSSQESNASTNSDLGVKKRVFDEEGEGEEEEEQSHGAKGLQLPPVSAAGLNRNYKIPVSKRGHHQTVARSSNDVAMACVTDDFDEAGFLRPVEDIER